MVFLACDHYASRGDVGAMVLCPWGCGPQRATSRPEAAGFIADVPEHYNVTLGEYVRGRTHLRQLQRQFGCHDYEPQGDQRARHREFLRRARRPVHVQVGR